MDTSWRNPPCGGVVLALASIPIAIAANAVRILGTGLCVQYWDPDKAMGFFHEFSGWVMFLVSLGCLYLSIAHVIVPGQKAAGMKNPRFWSVVLLLAATVLLLHARRQCRSESPSEPLSQLPPVSPDGGTR
jgi:exosortase/archaeosortase family protein